MAKKPRHRRPRPPLPVSSARPTASWKSRTRLPLPRRRKRRRAAFQEGRRGPSPLPPSNDTAKSSKKDDKPKKKRFQFFRDVKSEMKRVTWPTRTDVLRWSGVVVVALLFFGIFVALLDNVIITPLLVFISGIGA